MPEAIETFSLNHPEAWSDARDIEKVRWRFQNRRS